MAIEVIDGIIYHNNQAVAKLAANITHIDEKDFINAIELGGDNYLKYEDFYHTHVKGLAKSETIDGVKENLAVEIASCIDPKWGTITKEVIAQAIDEYEWSDYVVNSAINIER